MLELVQLLVKTKSKVYPWKPVAEVRGEDRVIRNEARVLEGLSIWILNLLVVMRVVGKGEE